MTKSKKSAGANAERGIPKIALHAGSYNLQELLDASLTLKQPDADASPEEKREFRKQVDMVRNTVTGVTAEVLVMKALPPIPNGTEIAEIQDAQGRTVIAPVSVAGEEGFIEKRHAALAAGEPEPEEKLTEPKAFPVTEFVEAFAAEKSIDATVPLVSTGDAGDAA